MTDKSVELILNNLNTITSKLGMAAHSLWPYLVRQQYINVIFSLSYLIICSLILCALIYYCAKHWDRKEGFSICKNDLEPIVGFIIIVIGSCLILYFFNFLGNLKLAFNPNIGALHDLITMIKPK